MHQAAGARVVIEKLRWVLFFWAVAFLAPGVVFGAGRLMGGGDPLRSEAVISVGFAVVFAAPALLALPVLVGAGWGRSTRVASVVQLVPSVVGGCLVLGLWTMGHL